MRDNHGQVYRDAFAVGVNLHFYKSIKYMLAVPFLLFMAALATFSPQSYTSATVARMSTSMHEGLGLGGTAATPAWLKQARD
jgi:hypothetical protein